MHEPEFPRTLGTASRHQYSEIGQLINLTHAIAAPDGVSRNYDPTSPGVIEFFRNHIVAASQRGQGLHPIAFERVCEDDYTTEIEVQIALANAGHHPTHD